MDKPILTAKAVFDRACELTTPEERQAFLDRACENNTELRQRVEALLHAYDGADNHPDKPISTSDVAPGQWFESGDLPETQLEGVGSRIGPYKLLQQIGEGGMGVVFMAEQQEPVRRMVAVKVIKAGMDTAQVIARFEAERQALALMDHPNIAKVFETGTTHSSRPYFVMELVKGIPITKYCNEQRLTLRQRLELFVPVCQAVQHAHQKGIIHRDLKPTNVLVAAYDGKPAPKIIDFGVAKAMGQKLTERTLFTGFGSLIGTLEYMSPEQAEFNALDIDTRSDIYSLGVMLYELLTGTTPLKRQRVKEAALTEVLRLIHEEEAPRPSTRLSETKESLAAVSAQRHMEPAALVKALRGEVDWIVMKALEKDRTRRYETANGFARDIQRYLADEPVEACPPSATYRLRKMAWKHRHGLATAAAFALLLLVALAISVWQAVRATAAERAAQHNEMLAVNERNEKEEARQQAQRRLQQIQKANDLLAGIFEDMNPRDLKEHDQGNDIPDLRQQLSQRLNTVAEQLNRTVIDDPATLARLQHTLGVSLSYLDQSQRAIDLLREAWMIRKNLLGPDDDLTVETALELANAYHVAGRPREALPLAEEVLVLRKARLSGDHPKVLEAMNDLALKYNAVGQSLKALSLLQEVLEKRKASLAADDPEVLANMHNLGSIYNQLGQLDKGVPLLEKTLAGREAKHGVNHFATTRTRHSLAVAYLQGNRPDKAIPLLQQVVQQRERTLGPNHRETLGARTSLTTAYLGAGRSAEDIPLFEQALKQQEAKLGPDDPNTLQSRNNLAQAYLHAGRIDEAIRLHEQTLKQREATLGPEKPATLISRNNLAQAYLAAGRIADAIRLHEQTLKQREATLGPERPATLNSRHNLAVAYDMAGDFAKAEPLLRAALEEARKRFGADDTRIAARMASLGLNLLHQHKYVEVEPLLRDCLKIREAKQPDAWTTFKAQSLLGGALLGQKKYADAEPLLLKGYQGMKQREAKIRPPWIKIRMSEALDRLVQLYEAIGKKDESEKWRKELEEAKRASTKMTHP